MHRCRVKHAQDKIQFQKGSKGRISQQVSIAGMTCMLLVMLLFTGCTASSSKTTAATDVTSSTDSGVSASMYGNGSETGENLSAKSLAGFRIICLPVGKGDAFILYTKNGTVLIDTGYDEDGDAIAAYLRDTLGIQTVDDMIITHYDKDHVGGADKIIGAVTVSTVVLNAFIKESADTQELFDAVSSNQVSVVYPGYADTKPRLQSNAEVGSIEGQYTAQSYTFTLDQVSYTIYPCEQQQYDTKDSNNSSMIVKVIYGNNKFLFTGDAEGERLSEFLAQHDGEHYDFVKMPYHGAYFKEVRKLISSASPAYAVITASDTEPADTDTLKLLKKSKVNYYLTQKGTVIFTSDGQNIKAEQ